MNLSLPIFGALILVASVSGAGDDQPTGDRTLVRDLEIEADYGQIYIYDPQTQLWDEDSTEDDNPLQRAMDDAYNSRRFVGYDSGLVDLLTPSQYNWKVPMRIEVSDRPPPLDEHAWDHVVETPLPVPSGMLYFEASGGGTPIEAQIPAGTYRARLSGRGFVAGAGEIEGHESYRLQLWPADEVEAALVKYWRGYDVVRPHEE